MENKPNIVVWYSSGMASAVAVKYTIDIYSKDFNIIVANIPIKEEHPDNIRFNESVEKWLNIKITYLFNSYFTDNSIFSVFKKRKFITSPKGAPCTMILKKQTRYEFENKINIRYHVLGFTLEEKNRFDNLVKFERKNILPVLIDSNITKQDCFEIIYKSGIELPFMYRIGFEHNNCIGCVKSSSASYWNNIRKYFPDNFNKMAVFSRSMNYKLINYKGNKIFLDELPLNAKSSSLHKYECSIFCYL